MTLDRTQFRRARPGRTLGVLRALGVPRQMLYVRKGDNASFWIRAINHLAVLETAERLFRREVRRLHPDKPGGSHEACVRLNACWRSIRRRFKERGHELE